MAFLAIVLMALCEEGIDASPTAIKTDTTVPVEHKLRSARLVGVTHNSVAPNRGGEPNVALLQTRQSQAQDQAQAKTLNRWVEEDIKLHPHGHYHPNGAVLPPPPPPPVEEKAATRRRRHRMPPPVVEAPPAYEAYSPIVAQTKCGRWLENATSSCQVPPFGSPRTK